MDLVGNCVCVDLVGDCGIWWGSRVHRPGGGCCGRGSGGGLCMGIWCECESHSRDYLANSHTPGPPVHQVKFGAPRRKETDPLNEPVRGASGGGPRRRGRSWARG